MHRLVCLGKLLPLMDKWPVTHDRIMLFGDLVFVVFSHTNCTRLYTGGAGGYVRTAMVGSLRLQHFFSVALANTCSDKGPFSCANFEPIDKILLYCVDFVRS
jgi:hypothetical protein